ncbi:MAG: metal-binding protein [Waddliaceae bacterium]|nr:metal-binding protein [Waddliaceae bacterium]
MLILLRHLLIFLSAAIFVTFSSCQSSAKAEKPNIEVSIAPYRYFVERLIGEHITVDLLVPIGANSHSFEPTPQQAMRVANADLWLRIGDAFEDRIISAVRDLKKSPKIVDLRDGIDLIAEETLHHHDHSHSGKDPHTWLSPALMKHQLQIIVSELEALYPEHASLITENFIILNKELDDLDLYLRKSLSRVVNRSMMVSHGAFAYFCREYNLQQIAIEWEGRDPLPQQLTHTIQMAREHSIKKIYVQPQFSQKGATLIAHELGAELVLIDPYSEDYFSNLRRLANELAED